MTEQCFNLDDTALRLRTDTRVEALTMDASFWPRLMNGDLGDFHNEFLITQSRFSGRWSQAEMHPMGDEIVCLLAGQCRFVLQKAAGDERLELDRPGSLVVVPAGVWHYAESGDDCTLLFITAGEDTQHRPNPVS